MKAPVRLWTHTLLLGGQVYCCCCCWNDRPPKTERSGLGAWARALCKRQQPLRRRQVKPAKHRRSEPSRCPTSRKDYAMQRGAVALAIPPLLGFRSGRIELEQGPTRRRRCRTLPTREQRCSIRGMDVHVGGMQIRAQMEREGLSRQFAPTTALPALREF
ncbi:uncharacterized protein SCHCODRAFT_02183545 [Schizophyllum commune H4-8]|uniref:uncharacterized protein n=1 Tax=Schizophyllum commune (strain H4-8 / FGSC 9210) TaxID=578458 RepID=UPI0021607DF3|nr:uncharacterized protein SCHCODRAFT_02183545 [Schizophyllum commune H4-8]KAI5896102.1 hypothetical protein SCHCODRAFT_02183545 [Schizophyllum commune H4-8]